MRTVIRQCGRLAIKYLIMGFLLLFAAITPFILMQSIRSASPTLRRYNANVNARGGNADLLSGPHDKRGRSPADTAQAAARADTRANVESRPEKRGSSKVSGKGDAGKEAKNERQQKQHDKSKQGQNEQGQEVKQSDKSKGKNKAKKKNSNSNSKDVEPKKTQQSDKSKNKNSAQNDSSSSNNNNKNSSRKNTKPKKPNDVERAGKSSSPPKRGKLAHVTPKIVHWKDLALGAVDAGDCAVTEDEEILCLPIMVTLGQAKAGTGEMQRWLVEHPSLAAGMTNFYHLRGVGEVCMTHTHTHTMSPGLWPKRRCCTSSYMPCVCSGSIFQQSSEPRSL